MVDPDTSTMQPQKPWWMPDTQGFLAIAVVASMVAIILILLLKDFHDINDKVFGALLTLSGVVASSYKDVYSFFFGSSKGSSDKDTTINKIAVAAAPVVDGTRPATAP